MSLATWNTWGQNPTALFLNEWAHYFTGNFFNLRPDFICMQESGNAVYGNHLGPAIACLWNPHPSLATFHEITDIRLNGVDYNGYHVPWRAGIPGNLRCSMSILWRSALGVHAHMPINGWHDGNADHRPVFWVTPAAGRRRGCIHAPAGGNVPYIMAAANAIAVAAPVGGWILAGDINVRPGDLGPLPVGMHTIHTGQATHQNGSNLDYLLYDGAPAPYTRRDSAGAFVASDHLQVRFLP